MKIYLVRSSLFVIFLLFHQSLSAQAGNEYSCERIQAPTFNSIKYRASIDVVGNHLSGILICKTLESGQQRLVFINEIGATFFDITFDETIYHFNSAMGKLNKKAAKRTLAKDLGMILIKGIYKSLENHSKNEKTLELKLKRKGKVLYYPNKNCKQYPLVENVGRKKVLSIHQYYKHDSAMPDSIFVQHHKVNFTINLKQMDVTE
jgi:hypothetical protein